MYYEPAENREVAVADSPLAGARIVNKHFLLILGIGAAVWTLLLGRFFPGYLDPFVPFHIDHFNYLGLSGRGHGLSRYLWHYPRPLAYVLFHLLGQLGTRGMLVPVFALTLVNAALLKRNKRSPRAPGCETD